MKTKATSSRLFLSPLLKYTTLLCFEICVSGLSVKAQNLVPNPSFELMNTCPTGWHEGFPFISSGPSFAQNWFMPSVGTADYFNSCAPLTPPMGFLPVSVPVNMRGYQQPHTGQAYAGGLLESMANEYIETPLASSTISDHRYFISFWVNLADYSGGACDLIGAYASTDSIEMPTTTFLDMFTPQVENAHGNILRDSLGWQQIAGTYVSAGNERWLTLGCFHTVADLDTIQFTEDMGFGPLPMYYFYDDVCMLDLDGSPDELASSDSILCSNPSLTLQGRAGKHNFYWSDGSTNSSLTVTSPGNYWVKSVDATTCKFSTDTFRVTGGEPAKPNIGKDTSLCMQQSIVLKVQNGNYQRFEWNTGSTEPWIEVTNPGVYAVTAFSACGSGSDTIKIDLGTDCNCLFVPNAFTPNSNGLNDRFKVGIFCPLDYFALNIYNRFGERVFASNNPFDGWDGTYNGSGCEVGAYYYSVYYVGKNNQSTNVRELKGDITLVR